MKGDKDSERLSEKEVIVPRKYIEVVDLVGSKKITKRFIKAGLGSVTIIPVLGKKLLLMKQYRPALRNSGDSKENGWIYELPGGKIEEKEAPHDSALRELEEETGYTAGKITHLYNRYNGSWWTDDVDAVFLAENLTKSRSGSGLEEDEAVIVVPIDVERMIKLLKDGSIKDTPTRDCLEHWLLFKSKT